ncbi:tRNA (adenosine(37)-N6)-threonylcarbamoyltransferase complex dimerization subunit type 1 TsaB [Parvularcula marina]|uniref:tRNA (Adenosine(37)-N6)-threonylcarbamoyltransferase complex dimerization subunit type 1 TsaB n=1 Tax=Parvularcula marina TaxID=2292771 RepID=A0A371RIP2_9PROT|nr:tRNA (adenosine(37)-N6)-threonylcarbamoyltransferase complex dimerization subunit type 1 TsaB [Parvularcula marina]
MHTLAIDTCLAALSVGIGGGGKDIVLTRHIGVGHAEHLAPMIEELLAEAGLTPADIGQVAVTVGPGSFMGVRVGLSFASGFALTRGLPTLPITTLEALWLSAPTGAKGAVLIDARRGQVYGQVFDGSSAQPFLLDIDAARAATAPVIEGGGVLIGSGAEIVWPDQKPVAGPYPDLGLLLAAVPQLSPGPLHPLYLRPPDAAPMAKRA